MGGNSINVGRRSFLKAAGVSAAAFSTVASGENSEDNTEELIIGAPDDKDIDELIAEIESGVLAGVPDGAEVIDKDEVLGFAVAEVPIDSVRTHYNLLMTTPEQDGVKYVESNDMEFEIPEPPEWADGESAETNYSVPDQPALDDTDDPSVADSDDPSVAYDPTDDLFDRQYAPQQVGATDVWEDTFGDKDVTVAVVDQGVKYDHPDLQDRFDSVKGKNFFTSGGQSENEVAPAETKEIHGTHVAGIAAATTDNGTGVAGMSNAKILACRVFGPGRRDFAGPAGLAQAIRYATDQGADIINMSLGGGGSNTTVQNAIDYAFNNGALPIAAAGNDNGSPVSYPAAYDNCLAVSAVDENEQLAGFSNVGENVDVAGPGVDILSTWTDEEYRGASDYPGKYAAISGTSMACPAVAGVAALYKSLEPGLDPSGLRQRLKETAVDIGLDDTEQGAGRVKAAKVCDDDSGPNNPPNADLSVTPRDPYQGETVVLESSASDPDDCDVIDSYEWDFGDGTTATGKNAQHTYDEDGQYTVELTVTDGNGASDTATTSVDVQCGQPGVEEDTASYSGTISQVGNRDENTYSFPSDFEPSSLEATIDTREDFLWGVVIGEESYTPGEGSDTVVVQDYNLSADQDVTLVVLSREQNGTGPTGSYSLDLVAEGFGPTEDCGDPPEPPEAAISVSSTTVEKNTQVEFDASDSTDPDGTIENYVWDFGDGTEASGVTATHSYDATGDFTATVTVTDDDGQRDQASQTIQVTNEPGDEPNAAFTLDASTITEGESVTVDPSDSADPDGSIVEYAWNFGNGEESTSSAQTIDRTYEEPGNYDIVLTVTDDDGLTDSASRSVEVEPEEPPVDDDEEVTEITGSLSQYGGDTYSVATVFDSPDSIEFDLVGPSNADFDLFVTLDGRTPSVYDSDLSSRDLDSDELIEVTGSDVTGDSEFGVLVDSYSGSGDYTLTITEVGSGDGGGSDPEPPENEGPSAVAAADATDVEEGSTVTFFGDDSSDSDGDIVSYDWVVDGTELSGSVVEYTFDQPDTYVAELTVEDDDGATASDSVSVTVTEAPDPPEKEVTETFDSLSGYWDDDIWAYTPQFSSPSQLTIELSGPGSADFDLYVGVGYEPSTYDYDKKSTNLSSEESIVLEDIDASDEVNILVTAYSGSGDYSLTLTEYNS